MTAFWLREPAGWGTAGLAAAFLIACLPVAAYTLNHFYRDGAVTDSWFQAWLIWRNDIALHVPAIWADGSFFGIHLSPILLVPTFLSHFLPVGMIPWFAAFMGAAYGLASAAIYHAMRRDLGLRTRLGTIGAIAVAACYGLGGIAIGALQLPHFEILIVGFGFLFFAALARGERGWAWLWFALALSVREDAGFHLAAVLFVAQVIHRRRDAWVFVFAGLAAGLASFAIKHAFWPAQVNLMSSVFTGDPPYAHLTWRLAAERFWTIVQGRGYVWQPALVTIAWALWRRDLLVAAALAANIPWIALSVTAVSNAPGTLDQYYSFPLLLAAAWPLIAPIWRTGGSAPDRPRRQTLAWAFIMAVAMVAGWRDGFVFYPRAMHTTLLAAPDEMRRIDDFGLRLREAVRELGMVRADPGTTALWPDGRNQLNWLQDPARFPDAMRGNDTVIWFEPGLHDSLAWAAWLGSRLPNQFRVVGTNIALATNRRLDQMPTFAPLLAPTNVVSRRMRPTAIAQYVADGLRVAADAPRGLVAEGPHSWMQYGLNSHHGIALAPGRYQGQFEFRLARVKDRAAPVLRVEIGFYDARIVAAKDVRLQDLPAGNPEGLQPFVVTLPFEVTPDLQGSFLQLRAIHVGNAELVLRRVGVARAFDE